MVVFARTNWLKLLLIYYGPMAALAILWGTVSSRSLIEVLSWRNLSAHTGIVGSPVVATVAIFLYLFFVARMTVLQVQSGGKLLWLDDGALKLGQSELALIQDIEPSSVRLERIILGKRIAFELTDRRQKVVSLAAASYAPDLVDKVVSAIESQRKFEDKNSGDTI